MKSSFQTHKRKLTLEVLVQRIKKNSFSFLPEDLVKNQESATIAIGLILLGIDIPIALALEDEMGKYQIVSQGKALCSVMQYINGDFSLSETILFEGISGKRFDELSPPIVNRIYEHYVSISTCLAPASTKEEIKELVKSFEALCQGVILN